MPQGLFTQAVGFAAMAICIGSFQCRDSRRLLRVKALGEGTYILHYLLLGEFSGCVTLAVSVLNGLLCSKKGACGWADWKGWKWLFSALLSAACLLVWRHDFRPYYLCALVSNIGTVCASWSGSSVVIRRWKLALVGPFWLVYTGMAGSYSGFLCEAFGMASAAAAIIRYR